MILHSLDYFIGTFSKLNSISIFRGPVSDLILGLWAQTGFTGARMNENYP